MTLIAACGSSPRTKVAKLKSVRRIIFMAGGRKLPRNSSNFRKSSRENEICNREELLVFHRRQMERTRTRAERALHIGQSRPRLNCMNRHGLTELNRRGFWGDQLEVIRLNRADAAFKEWLNADARIS